MKLQIDTKSKTIKLEDSVRVSEFIDTLKKLFPNNEWKEFKLETQTTINNWNNPVIIRETPWREYPWYISTTPRYEVTMGTNERTIGNNKEPRMQLGTFNIEA